LLVGENGMTLGQLNFHPQALTLSSIEEVTAPNQRRCFWVRVSGSGLKV
jgi:hypothetical protein